MHIQILQKNVFVETVWPANVALFIYVLTHFVETVKWLDYSAVVTHPLEGGGARGPVFNSRLRQGLLCLVLCCVVVAFLIFVQKHIICHKSLQFL